MWENCIGNLKFLVYFTLAFFIASCDTVFNARPSEKVNIASEIRFQTAQKLKNEMDLIPFGFGGRMMDQIKMLGLVFQYRQSVTLKEARRILVKATDLFLDEINSNEKIRPYLNNYPFDSSNVSIAILLQKSDGSKVDQGELALIQSSEGFLEYEIHAPHTQLLSRILKETFEEANQKILE